ncbi:unnamed protein product [Microthlaspi erraticum]|uniref:Uncharacterized protein n=1 Tax=Microthlaspi erraticum TaxID=1685480 RepID=A0A6D2JU69_9BRAS|nr:unnamed protein product [Microthlaspi erraticum]
MEKVRCMLSESGFGEEFWAEAASTAAYLINRSPCSAIDHNVPEELWLNRKPGYKHLRRFGSVAYGTKGYKVWLLEEEKCVISRNVIFHEEQVFKDLGNETEKVTEGNLETGQSSETREIEIVAETSSEEQQGRQQVTENLVPGGATENGSNETEEEEEEQYDEDVVDLAGYQLAKDRKMRTTAPPARFNDYNMVAFALLVAEDLDIEEPQCYHEAMNSPEWEEWNDSMGDEMTSLAKNRIWILLIDLKTRKSLVAGFTQREGIDYDEVFAPVVKHVSIRILMSAVVNQDLELEQMDVKTAFLHGDLDQELYMEQPEGFEVDKDKDQVCLLKKSLYGLKQSPRLWNKKFNQFIIGEKFVRSHQDSCVYVKKVESGYMYLLLYVDDILMAAKDIAEIVKLKSALSSEFEMKDMGPASRILGIDIRRDREAVKTSYLKVLVTEDSECIDTEKYPYSSVVGSIMYAMIGTRPDIAYAIGLVSMFMSKPGMMHWEAVKWLLRYIKGSSDLEVVFTKNKNFNIQGYCDSDFAGDRDKRKSTSGYVFTVGGNTISWRSNLQPVVTLSTIEAEYIALTEAVKEAIWIKGLLKNMGFGEERAMVWCDSQSAICLSKNNVFHERTKHISYKYHFIREVIEEGEVEVSKVHTSVNPADILTKSVRVSTFESALDALRLIQRG